MTMLDAAPPRRALSNSLGLAKPPSETRVVAAMSGGVDSSVVAAMLEAPRLRRRRRDLAAL
ncbi:MAG: hypothetical protein R3C31_06620 [Hyphomonadaceae bacterium]